MLRDFEDCFDDKPGKLPNNVHLEVDPLKPPVVRSPGKIALLEPARDGTMEEDGTIRRRGETFPLSFLYTSF